MAQTQIIKQIIKKVGVSGGLKFFTKLKIGIFLILFSIIFFSAFMDSVQQGTAQPFIEDVGGRMFYVTQSLSVESLQIVEKGAIVSDSEGFFGQLWYLISTYFNLWFALISVYIWIKIWYKISSKLPSGDNSKWFATMFIALVFFFGSQIIFLLVFQPGGITKLDALGLPFQAFTNFFKALPVIIAPLVGLAEKLIPKNNTEILNQSINATI